MNRLSLKLKHWLLRVYPFLLRQRLLRPLLYDIRHRVEMIYAADESQLRLHVIHHLFWIVGGFILLWSLVLIFSRDPMIVILLLLASAYLYGLFQDLLVYRLESKLLAQLSELIANIRHPYHRHRMVLEALEEAAEQSPAMAKMHALRIIECLRDHFPDEALSHYYEQAPNRYLQALAGLSFLVFEYGDREQGRSSFYLQALAHLMTEVELDRVRRNRLHYLLQSLQTITVVPLLALSPLQVWASSRFPGMETFYASGKGFACKMMICGISFLCFLCIRHMQSLEHRPNAVSKPSLIERLLLFKPIEQFLLRWIPSVKSMKFEWLGQWLLTLTSDGRVMVFYLRRIISGLCAFVMSLTVVWLTLHYEQAAFHPLYVVIGLLFGFLGYLAPLFFLMYRRRLRRMSLQFEVEQFQLLLGILVMMERMSVEQVLQWLERFAHHFKRPLQTCMYSFASGGWQALEEMKEQTGYPPFTRLIEKLQLAVERIELVDAFDDLTNDRDYLQEQRKLVFEKMIHSKMVLGKLIGFIPLYAVVFLYLMAPMLYVSAQEMQTYYQQMQSFN